MKKITLIFKDTDHRNMEIEYNDSIINEGFIYFMNNSKDPIMIVNRNEILYMAPEYTK